MPPAPLLAWLAILLLGILNGALRPLTSRIEDGCDLSSARSCRRAYIQGTNLHTHAGAFSRAYVNWGTSSDAVPGVRGVFEFFTSAPQRRRDLLGCERDRYSL